MKSDKLKTDAVKTFIKLLLTHYELDEVELNKIWQNHLDSEETKCNLIPFSPSELRALKKIDLQLKCKEKQLLTTGTKEELINRLLGRETEKPTKGSNKKNKNQKLIFQKIIDSKPVLHIRRNKFNNFEDLDTGFVFNENHIAIGKQIDENVVPLDLNDIEICKDKGFQYEIILT